MKSNVSLGYSTPKPERVMITNFFIEANGESLDCLAGGEDYHDIKLPGWSSNSNVDVNFVFDADLLGIAEDCHLLSSLRQGTANFVSLIEWICPVTSFRGSSERFELQSGDNRIKVTIPGIELAGSVRWKLSVVLEKNENPDEGSISPVLPGSYLWRERGRIILEGIASSFPIKEVDFAEMRGADNRELWRIDVSSDLDQHISRGILILLNKGNRYTKKALLDIANGKVSQVSSLWLENFELQVRVQLLQIAIAHGAETDLTQYENFDETVGQLLLQTQRMYFGEFDSSTLSAQFAKNPSLLSSFIAPYLDM